MTPPKLATIPKHEFDDKTLLDALRDSSIGAKATNERKAKLLERRAAQAKDRAELLKEMSETLPELQAAVDGALKEFLDAQDGRLRGYWSGGGEFAGAQAIARVKLDVARDKCVNASLSYGSRLARIEHALRETASPLIAEFCREMRDEHSKTRKTSLTIEHGIVRNPITGRVQRSGGSNASLVVARMRACLAAISAAEELMLIPDQSGVPAALQKLRDGLPSLSEPPR